MEKRLFTFLLLSFLVVSANMLLIRWLNPQPPAKVVEKLVDKQADDQPADGENAG